jgi:LytR cell envelope-related transcriptional attenuator
VNTGTARIVIIVALLVVGGLVLANGFNTPRPVAAGVSPEPGASLSPSPTGTSTETDSPPPADETPKPSAPKDIPVAVFNGTNTLGLAAEVMDGLVGDGYKLGQEPTDAPQKPVAKTVVYFAGGEDAAQAESNATALAEKYFKGARVRELSAELGDLVDHGVQVVVVIGEDEASTA